MTGSVMSAPRDIAQKVKKNMFGSADNIPVSIGQSSQHNHHQEQDHVGQSTFYTKSATIPQRGERISMNNNGSSGGERGRASTTHGTTTSSESREPSNVLEKDDTAGMGSMRRQSIGNRQQQQQYFSKNDSEQTKKLFDEFDTMRKKCTSLDDANRELNVELGVLRSELSASRFQVQVCFFTLDIIARIQHQLVRYLHLVHLSFEETSVV